MMKHRHEPQVWPPPPTSLHPDNHKLDDWESAQTGSGNKTCVLPGKAVWERRANAWVLDRESYTASLKHTNGKHRKSIYSNTSYQLCLINNNTENRSWCLHKDALLGKEASLWRDCVRSHHIRRQNQICCWFGFILMTGHEWIWIEKQWLFWCVCF